MSSSAVYVWLDTSGKPMLVGDLRLGVGRNPDSCTFVYDQGYLRSGGFPIAPDLPLSSSQFLAETLFGVFRDCAPDRWGRYLIRRHLFSEARRLGVSEPANLTNGDFLLETGDETRQGAIRISTDKEGLDFIARPSAEIPTSLDIERLARAAEALDNGESEADVTSTLLAAGGSGGGAQPKITVKDGGRLWIAKFPRLDSYENSQSGRWEKTALDIAELAKIQTPTRKLFTLGSTDALMVQRFDRGQDGHRIHYLSGITAAGLGEVDYLGYLDLAEFIAREGAAPVADLAELWRRIALNIAVGNTDDHGRNHGFIHSNYGWRLSPVFDLNPTQGNGFKSLSLEVSAGDSSATIENLLRVADDFRIKDMRAELSTVRNAVAGWREIASANNLPNNSLEEMESNFVAGLSQLDEALS